MAAATKKPPLTQLIEAIKASDSKGVKAYLHKVEDVNAVDPVSGYTPLVRLANNYSETEAKNTLEIAKLLLAAGADPNTEAPHWGLPLAKAVAQNNKKLVKLLLENGADVNKKSKLTKTTAFHAATMRIPADLEMIQMLVEKGAEIDAKGSRNQTALSIVATNARSLPIVEFLIKHGANVNNVDIDGYTPLFLATKFGSNEIVEVLLAAGADVNYVNPTDKTTALYEAARREDHMSVLFLLKTESLDKDAIIKGKTIYQHALSGTFHNDTILYLIKRYLGPQWKGWTQSDAAKFDTVFGEDAANWSACPVCLKLVVRQDGCMYMHHNCQQEAGKEGFFYTSLYSRYKQPDGSIWWCTVCNRICWGHRHLVISPVNTKTKELRIWPAGDPFEPDCRTSNNGGGLPEKVKRFAALRNAALKAQKDVGKISEDSILGELVEKLWNAPLDKEYEVNANKLLANKAWNIPSNTFPLNAAPPAEEAGANAPPAPNIRRPAANAALLPLAHTPGPNVMLMGDEVPKAIQFRHRRADGTVNNHEGEFIGIESLKGFLEDITQKFGTEEFGMCWNYAGGCTARLYPEELEPFVGDGPNDIPRDLYERYKARFNQKFQGGGSLRSQRSRKTRRGRKAQRGGGNENGPRDIFVMAEETQCYRPGRGAPTPRNRTVRMRQKGGFYPSVMEGVRGAAMLTPLAMRQAYRLWSSRRASSGTRRRKSKRTTRKR